MFLHKFLLLILHPFLLGIHLAFPWRCLLTTLLCVPLWYCWWFDKRLVALGTLVVAILKLLHLLHDRIDFKLLADFLTKVADKRAIDTHKDH